MLVVNASVIFKSFVLRPHLLGRNDKLNQKENTVKKNVIVFFWGKVKCILISNVYSIRFVSNEQ